MSRIQTKKQLLKEISSLVDDYINFCLNKKPSYEFKIEGDNEKETKVEEQLLQTSHQHLQPPLLQPPLLQPPQQLQQQPMITQTTQTETPTTNTTTTNTQKINTNKSVAVDANVGECSNVKCCESKMGGESDESDDPIKMLAEMDNPHSPLTDMIPTTKKKKVPAKVTKKQAANIEGRKEARADVESSKKKCVGLLTNWKRCTRDRDPLSPDPELCSFHNNPKFIGKIEKLDLKDIHESSTTPIKPTIPKKENSVDGEGDGAVYLFNPAADGAVLDNDPSLKVADIPDPLKTISNVGEDSHDSDDVQVFIKRDEDGDLVDQDANIWDVKDKKIIGKKDLMTKQKIFFQKI